MALFLLVTKVAFNEITKCSNYVLVEGSMIGRDFIVKYAEKLSEHDA